MRTVDGCGDVTVEVDGDGHGGGGGGGADEVIVLWWQGTIAEPSSWSRPSVVRKSFMETRFLSPVGGCGSRSSRLVVLEDCVGSDWRHEYRVGEREMVAATAVLSRTIAVGFADGVCGGDGCCCSCCVGGVDISDDDRITSGGSSRRGRRRRRRQGCC